VLGIIVLAFAGCGRLQPCQNEIISRERSPDGTWDAVRTVRGCGATVRSRTGVSIIAAGDELPSELRGNVLYYWDSVGAGLEPMNVRWLSPGQLEVTYDHRANVHVQSVVYNGVRISYKTR
jgi:hypothetical protein